MQCRRLRRQASNAWPFAEVLSDTLWSFAPENLGVKESLSVTGVHKHKKSVDCVVCCVFM